MLAIAVGKPLDVRDLSFSYGAVLALSNVTMAMPPGRITCVMGRNGVGKTTLMRNIMGTLRRGGGRVLLDGRDISNLAPYERARSGIALVPQGRQIFPKLTVEENLLVGLQACVGRKKIPDEVREMFPILTTMSKRMGGDLSGGQQQQLAIARALVGNPSVLLLDEPTEGIQPNIIQQIGHVLKGLVEKQNLTIVLVEQYVDFVREFGNSFYILNRGRVAAEGQTADLTHDLVSQHLSV